VRRPLRTKGRSCAGKRRHKTQQAAVKHQRALEAKGGVRLNTYWCRHCGGWHVGHWPEPRA
jgi:hypothetical protein